MYVCAFVCVCVSTCVCVCECLCVCRQGVGGVTVTLFASETKCNPVALALCAAGKPGTKSPEAVLEAGHLGSWGRLGCLLTWG